MLPKQYSESSRIEPLIESDESLCTLALSARPSTTVICAAAMRCDMPHIPARFLVGKRATCNTQHATRQHAVRRSVPFSASPHGPSAGPCLHSMRHATHTAHNAATYCMIPQKRLLAIDILHDTTEAPVGDLGLRSICKVSDSHGSRSVQPCPVGSRQLLA
jgi:hypothetical protein